MKTNHWYFVCYFIFGLGAYVNLFNGRYTSFAIDIFCCVLYNIIARSYLKTDIKREQYEKEESEYRASYNSDKFISRLL